MEWILAGLAIVVLAAAAVVGSGRWGEMPPAVDDRYPGMVPDGTLTGDDLRATRFKVVPRGYSMTQVDELLERLTRQLDRGTGTSTASAAVIDDPRVADGRSGPESPAARVTVPDAQPVAASGAGETAGVPVEAPTQTHLASAGDEPRSL